MSPLIFVTPKRHILGRSRVWWAIVRQNPFSGLTCRLVCEKKGIYIYKKVTKPLYFTHLPRRPPRADLHQILHSWSPTGRNHVCHFCWQSVKGFPFCKGSKFAISHWLWMSPLIQCSATALPVIHDSVASKPLCHWLFLAQLAEILMCKLVKMLSVCVCVCVCVCVDVNQGGTVQNRCTQRLVIFGCADLY